MTGINTNIRLTYGAIKNTVGLPLGYCGTNPNLMPLVNEGTKILWDATESIHKVARYKFKIVGNCCGNRYITWPREVETVEMLNVCGTPIPVRNVYFEFIGNGPGNFEYFNRSGPGPGWPGFYGGSFTMAGDREEVPTLEDISAPSHLKFVNANPADNGQTVLLLGYDQNEQWIRTLQNGTYADGEVLTMNASSPPMTQNIFSVIKGVQFATTPRAGLTYLVEHNASTGVEATISTYQYNEEFPVFRRTILTGSQFATCVCVIGLVRLRWLPIMSDTDYLQISNLSALKDILLSLQKRDNGNPQDSATYQQLAVKKLNDELSQYAGVAPKKVLNFTRRNFWSTGANMR